MDLVKSNEEVLMGRVWNLSVRSGSIKMFEKLDKYGNWCFFPALVFGFIPNPGILIDTTKHSFYFIACVFTFYPQMYQWPIYTFSLCLILVQV